MKSTRDILAKTAFNAENLFDYLMLDAGDVKLRHHKQSFLRNLCLRHGGFALLDQTLDYARKELAAAETHPKIVVQYVPWGGQKIHVREPNARIEPIQWMIAAIEKICDKKNVTMCEMEQQILASLPSPVDKRSDEVSPLLTHNVIVEVLPPSLK